MSGCVAASTLVFVYAEAMMHLPPRAAVLRVSQATTSPASSLWNGSCEKQLSTIKVAWRPLVCDKTAGGAGLTIDLFECR